MLSDMLRSKHSYQRNTYTQSSNLYKRKKGVSIDTNKRKMVSVPTDIAIISYTFSFVSAFFENF